jgi:hypothetical protein
LLLLLEDYVSMDILHFMKEEYSAIRRDLTKLAAGDLPQTLVGGPLKRFMVRLDLVVRVGAELILPEVMDSGRGAAAVALVAEDQLKSIGRIIAGYRKSEALADQKRAELFRKLSAHLDQMERAVLPLVRELVATPVREDIGEIALDYRADFRVGPPKAQGHVAKPRGVVKVSSTISA